MLDKKKLLGVGITNALKEEVLEYILQGLEKSTEKYYVVTPNPEILVYANNHPEFKSILNNARLALPDGLGVILAGKFLGQGFKERVTGTDLVENLCKAVSEKPITVGFLGAGPKIAERTAECLQKKYPGLNVIFIGEEWPDLSLRSPFQFGESSDASVPPSRFNRDSGYAPRQARGLVKNAFYAKAPRDNARIKTIQQFNNSAIDILFVAFGFPKQEEWMAANFNKGIFRVAIGVGGAFDYISGKVPRAPVFIQKLGLEWLYRLIRQPWRAKRQLALLKFMFLVLKEKLTIAKKATLL